MAGTSGRATVCASSGTPLVGSESTSFPCPACSAPIGRSQACRVQSVKYVCPECNFVGP
ncbi:MAG: zinc finger domain-containing protein [Candidatus Thermoplasmatota archaeon]|nr:zinc finger domain-containing protein [Candidatus Thermoplasmatota archaeon]